MGYLKLFVAVAVLTMLSATYESSIAVKRGTGKQQWSSSVSALRYVLTTEGESRVQLINWKM
jgi:hypothetical protein